MKNDHFLHLVYISIKKIDSFIYIIIDCYISKKFYELMIDLNASRTFTAKYEHYLAYHKNNKIDVMNINNTETVHVQFELESIWLIKSITLKISIKLVKFHVIKTNTSFLISLADLDRLKVYFKNVENMLIKILQNDQKKSFSVIRRFDHDFFLWKNVIFTFDSNLCYLIETELRQLHKRFDHFFVRQLFNLLKQSENDVKKLILKRFTKFCIYWQKYAKSSDLFKFTLKNDVNFNFFVIVKIM